MAYNFNYRKVYGSQEYLIEVDNVEYKAFLECFLKAINTISPRVIAIKDYWMNDEIRIEIKTNYGKINVDIDIWETAFIMSEENGNCIEKIYELLNVDINFCNR